MGTRRAVGVGPHGPCWDGGEGGRAEDSEPPKASRQSPRARLRRFSRFAVDAWLVSPPPPAALELCSSPELACHVYGMWK